MGVLPCNRVHFLQDVGINPNQLSAAETTHDAVDHDAQKHPGRSYLTDSGLQQPCSGQVQPERPNNTRIPGRCRNNANEFRKRLWILVFRIRKTEKRLMPDRSDSGTLRLWQSGKKSIKSAMSSRNDPKEIAAEPVEECISPLQSVCLARLSRRAGNRNPDHRARRQLRRNPQWPTTSL